MTSVRDFRDRIRDPKLLADIQGFNRQEAQHSIVHNQYNARLRAQGVDVDGMTAWLENLLFDKYRSRFSREYTLAITAGLEHFTAISAHAMFDKRDIMGEAHPNVRAMYAWHAIEEVEHKGVAYDVMIDYAHVGYFKRVAAALHLHVPPWCTASFTKCSSTTASASPSGSRFRPRVSGGCSNPVVSLPRSSSTTCLITNSTITPGREVEQPGYEEWLQGFAKARNPVEASEFMRTVMAR